MKAKGKGVKLLVSNFGTAIATDISYGNMTDWKITGAPDDVNQAIKQTVYRKNNLHVL